MPSPHPLGFPYGWDVGGRSLLLLALDQSGLLETQSFHEADEDVVTDVDFTNMISEEEKEELKVELAKLEDEISTLRQVLVAKEKHLVEVKQKLGISLMNELKQNFSKSWHDMQTTSAYKKTHETLSHAGQKATAAISNVGTAISKKFGDMRSHSIGYSIRHSISMPAMRNSPTFKSFEEKVETTVTSLKVTLIPLASLILFIIPTIINHTKVHNGTHLSSQIHRTCGS
ncbi:tumor protein D53 isoform X2 [Lonchura striata]